MTPYLRAVRSLVVPAKGSNRCVIRTFVNPTDSNAPQISASGRAPAIQPVHRSTSRLAVSSSSAPRTMSASCKPASWLDDAEHLGQGPFLVGNEIEDAIRDQHVDAVIRAPEAPSHRRAARRRCRARLPVRPLAPGLPWVRSCRPRWLVHAAPTCMAASRRSVPAPDPMSSTIGAGLECLNQMGVSDAGKRRRDRLAGSAASSAGVIPEAVRGVPGTHGGNGSPRLGVTPPACTSTALRRAVARCRDRPGS